MLTGAAIDATGVIRAVVDPNVLVSARISNQGYPARIARAADAERFELIVSERLLGELEDVLMRDKFRRYATVEEVDELLAGLQEKGRFFDEGEPGRLVPEDPKDDYLVALALAEPAPTTSFRATRTW
ncbi:MAG: putative toxin-antitoxin system toxin component, PIN family [Rubrobacter sp.]|nr:putative toxin-antitoxin system toxin component, PIN family [Rubrobacter sp.]